MTKNTGNKLNNAANTTALPARQKVPSSCIKPSNSATIHAGAKESCTADTGAGTSITITGNNVSKVRHVSGKKRLPRQSTHAATNSATKYQAQATVNPSARSEERRVGKEGKSRWPEWE